ncbi:MAG: putative oxidoreductase [Halieaceae bacterium]|jgi:putative oxidoreductase
MSTDDRRLALSLLLLRVGIFIVMFVWTLDKFVNPAHSAAVFDHFYGVGGVTPGMFTALGAVQMLLVLAFGLGLRKRISYGLVMLLHAGSTLSSWAQYLDPFNNLLFFAAWPMFAACIALYLLRDSDTLFVLGK